MKLLSRPYLSVLLLLVAATVVAKAASAVIVETPLEFLTEGDFDGDGTVDVLVLDKASGAIRVGFENGGTLAWYSFASGVENATTLAAGRLSSTLWDSVAVASPSANRVHRLDPRDVLTSAGLTPVPVLPPGIGPSVAVAMDIGGIGNTTLDDYVVVTSENPGPRRALLRNIGSDTSTIADAGLTASVRSGAAVETRGGESLKVAFMSLSALSGRDTFDLFDLSAGTVALLGSLEVPLSNSVMRSEYVVQRFNNANEYAQALFYRPGDDGFIKYQLQQTVGYQFASSNRFGLGAGMQSMRALPHKSGARLIAFFGPTPTNLTNAVVYTFNGVAAPQIVQSFSGQFSGAVATGDNLVLLNAGADGRSTAFQTWLSSGGSYVAGASGSLPRVHRFSGAANALLFDAEPFVNAAARPRQFQRHADWSTALGVTPTVTVAGQDFVSSSNGLGSTSVRDFGAPASGVVTGLVNQYAPAISVFSGRPAQGRVANEVRIAPAAGHYGEAQRIQLSASGAFGWEIRYRLGPQLPWISYSSSFLLSSNATVEFYARHLLTDNRTSIGSARYTFSAPPFEIDSDNDGVPDFVEQSRGLDPAGGADSDGDGYTDLEELALGTNPNSNASKPAMNAAVGAAFNRIVSPRSPNPTSGGLVSPRTNVAVRAYAAGSAFLGQDFTRANIGSGTTNPAALLSGLIAEPGVQLIVETTPEHYDVNVLPDRRVGRELIGLFLRPDTNDLVVSYSPIGGTVAQEVAGWIAAANSAVAAAGNPTVAGLLTPESALVAALYERHAALALLARGTNWGTNATLFPFRGGDAARTPITLTELLTIEQYAGSNAPGFKAPVVFNFLDTRSRLSASVAVLAAFSRELWRVSAQQHNANEGTMALPFDELRRVIGGGALGPVYSNFPSLTTNVHTAQGQAASLLAAVPERPRATFMLVVSDFVPGEQPTLRNGVNGTPVTLWVREGQRCAFPPNMTLLPGSEIAVFGHTDLPSSPGNQAVEVIAMSLASLPVSSATDANGNLLADSWEQLFLGTPSGDAFGDADGDGYSNLQEMLQGSLPTDALTRPAGTPLQLAPPAVQLAPAGGQWSFVFTWPDALLSSIDIGLEGSDSVTGPFLPAPVPSVTSLGNNQHELRVPATGAPMRYYRLTFALGPNVD